MDHDHNDGGCESLIEMQLCQVCGHHEGSTHDGRPISTDNLTCQNCTECRVETGARPAVLRPCGCTNVTKCRVHGRPRRPGPAPAVWIDDQVCTCTTRGNGGHWTGCTWFDNEGPTQTELLDEMVRDAEPYADAVDHFPGDPSAGIMLTKLDAEGKPTADRMFLSGEVTVNLLPSEPLSPAETHEQQLNVTGQRKGQLGPFDGADPVPISPDTVDRIRQMFGSLVDAFEQAGRSLHRAADALTHAASQLKEIDDDE